MQIALIVQKYNHPLMRVVQKRCNDWLRAVQMKAIEVYYSTSTPIGTTIWSTSDKSDWVICD